jgi:hypothetical protein
LYQLDFYPEAYLGPTVKIEGHGSRWHGFQAIKTNLVGILEKLDSVIDLKFLNCIRLRIELSLNLLSLYKERLGTPLVQTIIQSIQRKGWRWLDVGLLLDHESLNQYKSFVPRVTVEFLGSPALEQSSRVTAWRVASHQIPIAGAPRRGFRQIHTRGLDGFRQHDLPGGSTFVFGS